MMSTSHALSTEYLEHSPPQPFYAESSETSRQLFKAATTPSPRIKRRRRDSPRSRSTTPRPEDSRSQAFESPNENPFAPHGKSAKGKEKAEVPVGFGLGLGIPVFPSNSSSVVSSEPLIAWRFAEISKPSSAVSPASPSPTESVDGDSAPVPPGDDGSIYTLTPGPAWPPPPSTIVSPEITPRSSLDLGNTLGGMVHRRGRDSNDSIDFENMPVSPLTPAITQLLDEISTMERPPSAGVPKNVTTVQAWVMDMPGGNQVLPGAALVGKRERGEGRLRVRKMRSWRNLRALGNRTSQFEVARQSAVIDNDLPSPPITPPGQMEKEQNTGVEYAGTTPRSMMPESPIEHPFYDDYEDIIEAHLSPREEEAPKEEALPQTFLLDPSPEVERQFQDWPQETVEQTGQMEQREQEEEQETPRPPQLEVLQGEAPVFLGSPPQAAPDSPATQLGGFEPMTPDPNSDLVGEIEALLRSSPLRRREREEAQRSESLHNTPTQATIRLGTSETHDMDETPRPLQRPTFAPTQTQESLASEATNDTIFFTPTEVRTPVFEIPNPLEAVPPVPVIETTQEPARPQTPPPKAARTASISSSHSTPTRPLIPTRRSSLSHSRNVSAETIPTKSYPPTSSRPGAHIRGKSIDSSSLYNDRGRNYPPPAQRQRSSSASDATEDVNRGRGRSRSIGDGPPQIPARKSSVGKTGKPSELMDNWVRKEPFTTVGSHQRPSLGAILHSNTNSESRKDSNETVSQPDSQRFSFSNDIEILGANQKAEVITTDIVRSGSVKEVLVRTSSKGSKSGEPTEPTVIASIIAAPKPEQPNASTSSHHVPSFSFGEGPDLSFGESSASAGKGKGRAKDQTPITSPLSPVTFHLIPPTPAAGDEGALRVKQLGFQPPPIPISLTGTPTPPPKSPLRKSTPNPLAGVPVVHSHSASDSVSSIPLPPRLPSVVHEINGQRPSTAPEPLIDFENTMPTVDTPKRPSLKSRPTGFKKSKLSPWWKPKYNYFHDYDEYDQGGYGGYNHDCPYDGIDLDVERGRQSRRDSGSKKGKKGRRTVSLGKVQLEFVGVKGLRESFREMKEERKRKKEARGHLAEAS
ncbi:hypothetical protein TWF225_008683 [Orbilia oligospora]|nr:hypothetical protein TWF225_008683 [Orbilia oligospora]KAF3235338.1 hypothetical protein TWF128_001859 [Orbilia oligospora]KAF3243990.1 hypothetical protein TWF217_011098 [Orbilia oligospora]KAF3291767.1 hypothetical protein TWF132_006512 [Orbilia oligospora]